MIHAIDDFGLLGGCGGTGDEAGTAGGVHEDDVIQFRVEVWFHGRQWMTVDEYVTGLPQQTLRRKNPGKRKRSLGASQADATGIQLFPKGSKWIDSSIG